MTLQSLLLLYLSTLPSTLSLKLILDCPMTRLNFRCYRSYRYCRWENREYLRHWKPARYSKSSAACGVAVERRGGGSRPLHRSEKRRRSKKESDVEKKGKSRSVVGGECWEVVVAKERKRNSLFSRGWERWESRHNHVLHAPNPELLSASVTRSYTGSPSTFFVIPASVFYRWLF